MSTDTIKQLGAHFHHAADSLADTLARLDNARLDRLAFLRRCSKDSTARLAAIKEELRTLLEQIAKWEAECAHLEASTAVGLVMGQEAPKPAPTEDPFIPGLPPLRLREVWAEWETSDGRVYVFTDNKVRGRHWQEDAQPEVIEHEGWTTWKLRPHGKTWAEVEAMADERERTIGDTPQIETIQPTVEGVQPTIKPPEDDDPVERAFWRFCALIDRTQRAARVKAGYLDGPYPQRDAFKIAVRSIVLGVEPSACVVPATEKEETDAREKQEPPALLDLRTLKVGTVCELTAAGMTPFTSESLSPGEHMKVIEQETDDYAGSLTTRVELSGDRIRWLDRMQPARVVEVPQ